MNTPYLQKGDIIISARGTVGALAQIGEPMCFNQSCFGIRGKQNLVDTDFLYYSLKNYVKNIVKRSQGSVFNTINLNSFDIMEITIPKSISTQKQIAKVLSDLDAKIEVNNKINQELEAMAKTLYDYWFVQFDFPFDFEQGKPDTNGKPYKSSGGKMVYNEELKREVPEGWEDGVLSDIAEITMGQSPAGSSYNEEGNGVVFYQGSTDFGKRFPSVRKHTTEATRMAEEYDILLSVRAPVGTLNQAMEKCCIGRGLAALREKNGSISFLWSQMEYFQQTFDRRNTAGTTFGSITKDDLFKLKLCIPNKQVLELFKKNADPFHEMIIVNSKENEKLAELRDWLLPMLMNGQVRVGELEERFGMVAEEREKYN
ncbi:MAG: restriction endonuclease subunit S [Crocinitomicaceae bacterium]|nr:restriction endonuclease subunit S [Crocinitomicaceae bacterium]